MTKYYIILEELLLTENLSDMNSDFSHISTLYSTVHQFWGMLSRVNLVNTFYTCVLQIYLKTNCSLINCFFPTDIHGKSMFPILKYSNSSPLRKPIIILFLIIYCIIIIFSKAVKHILYKAV